jgi:putative transposase
VRHGLFELRKWQRQFSRKIKYSKNRSKEKVRLAKLHETISNQRRDFAQKLSAKLAFNNHETSFAVEDLHIKGMIKHRKLSRALADSGWRNFINALAYKCNWIGKNILTINRFVPSSKICHVCHAKQDAMPLHIRKWRCDGCNTLHDRDINAAKNIKAFALADAAGLAVCVKQFPCNHSIQ